MKLEIIDPDQAKLKKEFLELIEALRSYVDSTTGQDSNKALARTLGVQRAWIERRMPQAKTQKANVKKMDIFALRYVVSEWKLTKGGFKYVAFKGLFLSLNDPNQEDLKLG